MGFKKPILTSVVLVAGVLFLAVFSGHSVTPSISLPDTFLCPAGAGSRISQDVTGASFPSVVSWQLNIAYDGSKVSVVSVTLGSAWNAVSHNTAIKNATGSLLYGYSTLNGAVVSGSTTLATIMWEVSRLARNYHRAYRADDGEFESWDDAPGPWSRPGSLHDH